MPMKAVDAAKPVVVAVVDTPADIPKAVEAVKPAVDAAKPIVVAVVEKPAEVVKPATEITKPVVVAIVDKPPPVRTEKPAAAKPVRSEPATVTVMHIRSDQPVPMTATPNPSPRVRRRSGSNIVPASPDVPVLILTKPDRKPSKLSMSVKAMDPFDDPTLGPPVIELSTEHKKPRPRERGRRARVHRFLTCMGYEPHPRASKREKRLDRVTASLKRRFEHRMVSTKLTSLSAAMADQRRIEST